MFFDVTVAEAVSFEEDAQVDRQGEVLHFAHLHSGGKLGPEV